ncbi:MAG: signal peptidase II [Lachnospiraceae bacterium]|nr:signal peptidase II [Lachnospiraceae bacterium]
MRSMIKRYGIFGILSFLLILFDQWTKKMAYNNLRGNGAFVIWEGVFELLYSENRGAAFGIMQGQRWFFLIISFVVVFAIIVLLYRIPQEKRYLPLYYCLILLVAGAVGNMIDRYVNGFVVDFLYFKLINFPIFNVADCYVVVSAFVLVFLTAFFYSDEELDFFTKKEK